MKHLSVLCLSGGCLLLRKHDRKTEWLKILGGFPPFGKMQLLKSHFFKFKDFHKCKRGRSGQQKVQMFKCANLSFGVTCVMNHMVSKPRQVRWHTAGCSRSGLSHQPLENILGSLSHSSHMHWRKNFLHWILFPPCLFFFGSISCLVLYAYLCHFCISTATVQLLWKFKVLQLFRYQIKVPEMSHCFNKMVTLKLFFSGTKNLEAVRHIILLIIFCLSVHIFSAKRS